MTDIVATSVTVQPEPDGRLAQLLAEYDAAKAWAEEADARFEAIKDGIKAELSTAAPGVEQVNVNAPGLAQPLRLVAVTSWRVDTTRLKTEDPQTYVRFAKQSTSHQLKAVK